MNMLSRFLTLYALKIKVIQLLGEVYNRIKKINIVEKKSSDLFFISLVISHHVFGKKQKINTLRIYCTLLECNVHF